MTADFVKSKIGRKVFEPSKHRDNEFPSKDNPAPGQYDTVPANEKKNFNAQGLSAVFLSKVPNCKNVKQKTSDIPGPGHYEKQVDQSKLGNHQRSLSDSGMGNNNNNQKNNNFLSTTKRDDYWVNDIKTPFTHPTNF